MGILFITLILIFFVSLWFYLTQKSSGKQSKPVNPSSPQQKSELKINIPLSYEVKVTPPKKEEQQASELLKVATAKHDSKDYHGAIQALRDAFKLMEQSSISYPIETFLRLPLYLQKAGRFDESLKEFQLLLNNTPRRIQKEFSHLKTNEQKGLICLEKSTIYDKMRLAYEREEKYNPAIINHILSRAYYFVGLKLQKRGQELRSIRSKSSWRIYIDKLIDPQKSEELMTNILNACMAFSKDCSENSLEKLNTEIIRLLDKDKKE